MTSIRSAGNAQFKALSKLVQSSRERKHAGLSLLDGVHLVAAYCGHVGAPQSFVVSASGQRNPEIESLLRRVSKVEPIVLADSLFQKLSSVVTPTGVIAVIETPRVEMRPQELDACVMVENLQDPGNLGSLLRSAAAAGMADVLLSKNSVHAWSPRVLRAGMGAHFLLRIHEGVDLAAAVREFKGRLIATSRQAQQSLFDTDLRGKVALVFGNEGAGVSPELVTRAHAVVAIPMPGKAESLNVAAAAAVCLFERVRQVGAVSPS
jgi:RNA methyltransferase, TrmH family